MKFKVGDIIELKGHSYLGIGTIRKIADSSYHIRFTNFHYNDNSYMSDYHLITDESHELVLNNKYNNQKKINQILEIEKE